MCNVKIYTSFIDGSAQYHLDYEEGGNILIQDLIGDDIGAPAKSLTIHVKTKSGKEIDILIPNDQKSQATVRIDGDII